MSHGLYETWSKALLEDHSGDSLSVGGGLERPHPQGLGFGSMWPAPGAMPSKTEQTAPRSGGFWWENQHPRS